MKTYENGQTVRFVALARLGIKICSLCLFIAKIKIKNNIPTICDYIMIIFSQNIY